MALHLPGALASSSRRPPPRPKLILDSGSSIHVVGDSRLLSNLRDPPAWMWSEGATANGNVSAITKIGDINIQGFTIPGVYLAPGLKFHLISVRELTRSGICTFFDGDRAMLYSGAHLVGEAVTLQAGYDPYVLQSLSVPNSSLDGKIRLLRVWTFGSVIFWLKAFLRDRLFGSGPEEKLIRELHDSNRTRRERRRTRGKNSGRRR